MTNWYVCNITGVLRKFASVLLVGNVIIFTLASCVADNEEDIIIVDRLTIESVIVSTYDITSNTTSRHWAYRGEELDVIADYLANLKGSPVNEVPPEELGTIMYGVEVNDGEYKYLLIAQDYAITTEGNYYLIDGDRAVREFDSLSDSLRSLDSIDYLVNHRALSLHEGQWVTDYMFPSELIYEPTQGVILEVNSEVTNETEQLEILIINSSKQAIEYGANFRLEVNIDDIWYRIDDMTTDSGDHPWIDILYILEEGEEKSYTYYIDYYNPLPTGKYRIIKELSFDKIDYFTGYTSWEFLLEN
jgi:hypothetical protein